MGFSSTSHKDMKRLAEIVGLVPEPWRAAFAADLVAKNLMRTHWWLHVSVALGAILHRSPAWARWYLLFSRLPLARERLIGAFQNHIVNGSDTYEWASAGGLSSGEVITVVMMLGSIGDAAATLLALQPEAA